MTVFSPNSNIDGYLDGRKVTFITYYTDEAYWEIFDFDFVYGLPFGTEDVVQGNKGGPW